MNYQMLNSGVSGSGRVYKALVFLITCVLLLSILEGLTLYQNSTCFSQQVPNQRTKHTDEISNEEFATSTIKEKATFTDVHSTVPNSTIVVIAKDSSTTNPPATTSEEPFEKQVLVEDDSQIKRQQHLRQFCQRNLHLLTEEYNTRNRNMLYSDKAAAVYCYVPKVACTNWKRVFQVFEGRIKDPLDIKRKEEVHKLSYRSFRKLNSTSGIAWRQNLYYSFLFVRHPFERVLSAYRNKLQDPYNDLYRKLYGSKILRMFRDDLTEKQYKSGRNVTFPEFVKYLLELNDNKKPFNEHWQVMHKLCHPCNIKYNFIGKMDTLVQDAQTVLQEMGWDDRVKFPAKAKDKYKDDLKVRMHQYYSELPKDLKEGLYNVYKNDFEAFNYNADEYV